MHKYMVLHFAVFQKYKMYINLSKEAKYPLIVIFVGKYLLNVVVFLGLIKENSQYLECN